MNDVMTAETIRATLSQVIDPEVGINIVDLGLIREVLVSEEATHMHVRMTMTSPACPMSGHIADQVSDVLHRRWPALREVEVELVWDPPWSTDQMSDQAKQQLGWGNT